MVVKAIFQFFESENTIDMELHLLLWWLCNESQ